MWLGRFFLGPSTRVPRARARARACLACTPRPAPPPRARLTHPPPTPTPPAPAPACNLPNRSCLPFASEAQRATAARYDAGFAGSPLRLVWRTSLGAGCLVNGTPLAPLAAMPRDTPGHWAYINATQKLYNFQLMEEWDALALEFWRPHPRAATLDLTPLWMRPDSMQGAGQVEPWNCIHVCMPGALRFAARQLMLLLQTELKG